MAHHKSAIKRIRTNNKANLRNRHYRSLLKTSIRRVLENQDDAKIRDDLRLACATLDRLAGKRIINRNTAGRKKSQLHKIVSKRLAGSV